MSEPAPTPQFRGIASGAFLLVASGLFGYFGTLPVALGAGLALGLTGAALALRAHARARLRAIAPVPALAALIVAALASPLGLLPELLAGMAGLAFLAWLADDPTRPIGGLGRARMTLLLPALALGIAWASALLLPSRAAPIGVAGGLLAGALVALAILIARPGAFDREEATI